MNWNNVSTIEALEEAIAKSKISAILLFKHSTRCSTSDMVLNRLERNWDEKATQIIPYFVDLIANRDVSNKIEEIFNITHESPQALIIKDTKCVYHSSHTLISYQSIVSNE